MRVERGHRGPGAKPSSVGWRILGAALAAGLVAFTPAPAVGIERAARSAQASHATPARGDFKGRVALPGGRKLYLECRGKGSPTVVLEAGTGDLAQVWSMRPVGPGRPVLPAVAKFTRVCGYDRPGTYLLPDQLSRSDPVATPRSAWDIVRDQRALLRAARMPGRFVLVGHSFGGMTSRLNATTHPGPIAGLVSIDAQSEQFIAAYKEFLTPEQYEAAVLNPSPPPELGDYPAELLDLVVSGAQMRQAQRDTPMRRMPLVIISHSRTLQNPFGFPPDWPIASLDQAFQASQDRLAKLVPGARHVIAAHSGHYIQLDQPKLVTQAIRWVIREARARHGR